MDRTRLLPTPLQRLHRELLRQTPMEPGRVHGWDDDGAIGVSTRQVGGREVVFVTLLRPAWELLDDRELARAAGLAPRQVAVARRLARRLTDVEIAADLGLRLSTTRRYAEAVMGKLQVHSRRDVAAALRVRIEAWVEHAEPLLRCVG
jgi:DNA-binding CsgD family transcriptional regulator